MYSYEWDRTTGGYILTNSELKFSNDYKITYPVSDKNGKLYFTKTYSEHQQMIKDLQNKGMWYEY